MNQNPVRIHFSGGDLTLAYGWTFWLTLCTGIVVFGVGVGTYLWCTWRHRSQLASIEYVWGDVAPRTRVTASEHHHQRHQSVGMHKRATSTSESRRADVSRSHGTAPTGATSTGGGGGVGATSSPAPSSSTPGTTTTTPALRFKLPSR